jgi:hypothetical protein
VQHRNDHGLNIKVLNLSFGTDSRQAYTIDPLAYAAEVAWRHGIVVVAAAGNDGARAHSLNDPAYDPTILAVGASDPNGSTDPRDGFVARFTSSGDDSRGIDVVAPGVHMISLRDPGSFVDTSFPTSQVGERFTRGAEYCLEHGLPLICFSSSGGARMQEGLFSLLYMSMTSAVLARMAEARLPFVSVLTDPTTGGVSASLAMLGDLNIAEPRALIGFAGPRVIEQTVRETLPEGFQRSEFLLEHGAIDLIVDRRDLRERIAGLLAMLLRRPPPAPVDESASAATP